MNNNNVGYNTNMQNNTATYDEELRQFLMSYFTVITSGILVSAFTVFALFQTGMNSLFINENGFTGLGMVATFLPLIVIIGSVFLKLPSKMTFYLISFLMSFSLVGAFTFYDTSSILFAMSATAATFGGAVLYGHTTKRNIASIGGFLMMGLFGVILASLINLIIGSSALDFAISCLVIIIFTGLTAYESYMIKSAYSSSMSEESLNELKYSSALNMYLNIINIFMSILRLTGTIKD